MYCASCGSEIEIQEASTCPSCSEDPRLDGRYVLQSMLGQGANGTTWRAVEAETGAVRAIKELPLRLGTLPKTVQLFHREAHVLQQLDHPEIPTCHEVLDLGSGKRRALHIVMDFVEGSSLKQELRHHRYAEGEVLEVLHGVLDVLVYLHGLSPPVVHRDIKPANVLRTPDGRLVVIDFGNVRDAFRDADLGGSTVAGTFGFMAPEQFHGDAEPRTDLYGLGAMAIALLTRKAPHTLADTQQRLRWREYANVSNDMGRLLDALTAQDLVDRPASAVMVREAVRQMRLGERLADDALGEVVPDARPLAPPVSHPAPLSRAVGPGPTITVQAASRRHASEADQRTVVRTIEQVLGQPGLVSDADEQGFTWTSTGPRRVRVEIRDEALGSRIVARESMSNVVGGLYGGLVGGLGGGVAGSTSWLVFAFGDPVLGMVYVLGALLMSFLLATGIYRSVAASRELELVQLSEILQGSLGGGRGHMVAPGLMHGGPALWAAAAAALATAAVAWMSTMASGEPLLTWVGVAAMGIAGLWSVVALARSKRPGPRQTEVTLARRLAHGLLDGVTSLGTMSVIGLAVFTWVAWDSAWLEQIWAGQLVWHWIVAAAAFVLPIWFITGAMARATKIDRPKKKRTPKKLTENLDFDDLEDFVRSKKRDRVRRRRRDSSDTPKRRR